jgi:rare lipoprotein A
LERDFMNQRFLSGLSAALVVSSFGLATSSYSNDSSGLLDDSAEEFVPGGLASVGDSPLENSSSSDIESDDGQVSLNGVDLDSFLNPADNPAAVIHSHVLDGRRAATVYVRGIPVVTFLGEDAIAQASSAIQEASLSDDLSPSASDDSDVPTSLENKSVQSVGAIKQSTPGQRSEDLNSDKSLDPVQSAAAIASRLNRLFTSDIDPNEIVAAWDDETESFVIRAGEEILVEFDSSTILPDTTGDLSEDVLQATNRIRRQFGASPLDAIEGRPSTAQSVARIGRISSSFTGLASWYGPGFHGRRSASGEVFNQHAMTAAHRTLPFGTRVRVTNINSGASVVVRINDRGPFGGGRVLDLSAGAAQAIGMIQTGVANVRIDVLDVQ